MNVKANLLLFVVLTLMSCKSNKRSDPNTSQKVIDSSKNYKKSNNSKPVLNFDSLANIDAYEKNYPTKFLRVTCDYIKNPLGQWLIKGIVKCSATMSDYSYLNLKLVYYFNRKRALGTSEKTIKEVFRSNTITSFEVTSDTFPNADSIAIKLVSAVVHL